MRCARMNERDEPAATATAWLSIDRSMTFGYGLFEGAPEITDGERHVVHPLTARGQKPRQGAAPSDRLQ